METTINFIELVTVFNWVDYNGWQQIVTIESECVQMEHSRKTHIHNVCPIPIDQSILLACKFKYQDRDVNALSQKRFYISPHFGEHHEYWLECTLPDETTARPFWWLNWDVGGGRHHIHLPEGRNMLFLHQLQNWWAVNSGKPLEIEFSRKGAFKSFAANMINCLKCKGGTVENSGKCDDCHGTGKMVYFDFNVVVYSHFMPVSYSCQNHNSYIVPVSIKKHQRHTYFSYGIIKRFFHRKGIIMSKGYYNLNDIYVEVQIVTSGKECLLPLSECHSYRVPCSSCGHEMVFEYYNDPEQPENEFPKRKLYRWLCTDFDCMHQLDVEGLPK